MLPVRNGAEDLPAYLESVGRYADAVVALDDGSTDDTRAILAAHPLVKVLLENPRRSSYTGWNDAANRNALLDAVAQLDPQWLLSLDADERIDEGDGAALRAFLETDALPGLAYYLRCYPTETEGGRYSPVYVWVPRLFAFEPGQRLPNRRLHFAPSRSPSPAARTCTPRSGSSTSAA
jgi:glycosyltransferase involved in cell wall biosynthesis